MTLTMCEQTEDRAHPPVGKIARTQIRVLPSDAMFLQVAIN